MNEKKKWPDYEFHAEKCVFIDGYYWFVALNYNVLCKMNAATGKAELVETCLGGEGLLPGRRYSLAEAVGHKLILLPQYAEKVLVYDINTGEFEELVVDIPELRGKQGSGAEIKFRSSAVVGDIVWLFPQSAHHILAYNTKTGKLNDYNAWYKIVEQYGWRDVNLFGFGIAVGKTLWLPCCQLNALVEFDTITKEAKLHKIGLDNNRFTAIAYTREKFWLIDNINQEMATWRPDKGRMSVNKRFPEGYGTDKRYLEYQWANIADLRPCGSGLIASPCMANSFLWIDTETEEISLLAEKPEGESYLQPGCTETGRMCYFSQNGDKMLTLDIRTGEKEIYRQRVSTEIFDKAIIGGMVCVHETADFPLERMVDMLLTEAKESDNQGKGMGFHGVGIYNKMQAV